MRRAVTALTAILAFAALAAPAGAERARVRVLDLASGKLTRPPAREGRWGSLGWRGHDLRAVLNKRRGAEVVSVSSGRTLLRLPRADDAWLGDTTVAELEGGRLRMRSLRGAVRGSRRLAFDALSATWVGNRLAIGSDDRLVLLAPDAAFVRSYRAHGAVRLSDAAAASAGRIAYTAEDNHGVIGAGEPSEVRLLDTATGAQTTLLRGTRCEPGVLGATCELLDAPAASGDQVAVVRDLNGVALLAPGAFPKEFSPAADCDGVQALAWTPDGTGLAVAYHDGSGTHIAQFPAGPMGAPPRTLANLGEVEIGKLAYSPDGAKLALTSSSYQR